MNIRVVELADRRNQYCGKLFADLGADVIQIEPLDGSTARRAAPFAADEPGAERSLEYWYYNTSKKSIAVNLDDREGQQIVRRLALSADLFLESRLGTDLAPMGLDYASLSAANPRLIQASITDFGQTGPWRDFIANDESHLALGGQMAMSGYTDETVAPMGGKGGQAYHVAGVLTANAVIAALYERLDSGLGQYADASIHDCLGIVTENGFNWWSYQGQVAHRHTGVHAGPQPTSFDFPPAADGLYVNTIYTELTQFMWVNLMKWMNELGIAGELADPKYMDEAFRAQAMRTDPAIREGIGRLIAAQPAAEVARRAQEECNLAWSVVRAPDENLDEPHWQARNFFLPVEHPASPIAARYPRGPFQGELDFHPRSPAPRIGQHTDQVLASALGYEPSAIAELRKEGAIG